MKFGEAAGWTIAWIALALVFYVIINTHGDLVHGMNNYADLETIKNKFAPHLKLVPVNFEASLEDISEEYVPGIHNRLPAGVCAVCG